ncbi:MAG: F0F1 ATP synthase subunit B [Thermoleophilia bacterium]|nr:F0F1 ATP synthase subunit B [Thermoleophilia bacterium]
MGTPLAEVHARHAENVLLAPSPGLMIWTAITFGLCLLILTKYVFPPVNAMIEKRRAQITESIEEATRSRDEAVALLEEYKVRLADAQKEADALRERGRKEGERRGTEIVSQAQEQRERVLADTQSQLDAETRKAATGLRDNVVDLAVATAQKATRGALSEADHRRLIEQAIDEADLSRLSRS